MLHRNWLILSKFLWLVACKLLDGNFLFDNYFVEHFMVYQKIYLVLRSVQAK